MPQSSDILIIAIPVATGVLILAVAIIIIVIARKQGNKKPSVRKPDVEQSSASNQDDLIQSNSVQAPGVFGEFNDELVFISKIKSDTFGDLWKGSHSGKTVAIKKIKYERQEIDEMSFIQGFVLGASIMKDMKHERVNQFIGFDFKTVSIIMELMPLGTLSTFIVKNRETMNWSTRYQMMLDICEGMAYLHSSTFADGKEKKEIIHQDLKSANVLLVEEEGIIRGKIGDYGLSRML
jgi:serine/threonine protein kinase